MFTDAGMPPTNSQVAVLNDNGEHPGSCQRLEAWPKSPTARKSWS